MDPESTPSPAPDASADRPNPDTGPRVRRPVRHRLPRRYRRQPRRATAPLTTWFGWLALACAPALLLLAVDRLDLRRPESQDYLDAQAMHRDLVQRFQRDAYTQPEAQAVVARLERVPSSSRNYSEAQDLLQRYRWEMDRNTEAEPAEPTAVVEEPTGRTWHPAAPSSPSSADAADGSATARDSGTPPTPIDSDAVTPTLPEGEAEPAGWTSITPSKAKDAPLPGKSPETRERIDRDLAARIGFRCYTASFGVPTPREAARFEVRLGAESTVRIGSLRVRNLRDLREGLHRLVASDAALDPLDDFLAGFSEDALARAALEPAAGSHWVWVDTERAPVFVDLLSEAARCQGRASQAAPENPSTFGGGATAGDAPALVSLPVDRAPNQALDVRWPRDATGAALELVLRVDGRPHPVARFQLPPTSPAAAR
ncbi:MAG: hypothetical protein U0610_19990 [bacterium]